MIERWHISPKDNKPKRCKATVQECKFEHYDSEQDAYDALERKAQDEHLTPDGNYTESSERITTLLSSRIRLNDDRKGKVPVLKDSDDAISAISKLGRYIEANFTGFKNDAVKDAIKTMYHETAHEWEAKDDPQDMDSRNILAQVRYLHAKTGSDVMVFIGDDTGCNYFVTSGKVVQSALLGNASYRNSGKPIKEMNFGLMLAGKAVCDEMKSDTLPKSIVANMSNTLMSKDKKTVYYNILRGVKYQVMKSNMNYCSGKYGYTDIPWDDHDTAVAYLEEREPEHPRDFIIQNIKETMQLEKIDLQAKYDDAISTILNDERNGELNRAYAKRSNSNHSATVYEDKKHQDEVLVQAAKDSSFSKDFQHIEIDDSVDHEKFDAIQKEYSSFREWLPSNVGRADFRFRKTGRHHALGVYTPAFRNISVDPRSPSALGHEYMHHWDYTSRGDGMQQSMTPEFRTIVSAYQKNIDKSKIAGTAESNYTAPTEVLARAGELWLHWKHEGDHSSFLATDDEYANQFDYQPLLPFKKDIIAFFDANAKQHD